MGWIPNSPQVSSKMQPLYSKKLRLWDLKTFLLYPVGPSQGQHWYPPQHKAQAGCTLSCIVEFYGQRQVREYNIGLCDTVRAAVFYSKLLQMQTGITMNIHTNPFWTTATSFIILTELPEFILRLKSHFCHQYLRTGLLTQCNTWCCVLPSHPTPTFTGMLSPSLQWDLSPSIITLPAAVLPPCLSYTELTPSNTGLSYSCPFSP